MLNLFADPIYLINTNVGPTTHPYYRSLMLWRHNFKLKVLLESITWDSNDFSGFYNISINAGTWKSTITNHIKDVLFDGVTSQRHTQSKMEAP